MNLTKIPVHQFKIRSKECNEHHLTPSSRGGESITSNLLRLERYRHLAWHYLFSNMTLDEIIAKLSTINSKKRIYRTRYSKYAFKLLFHDMTLSEIIFCLKRISTSKFFQKVKYRL